MPRLYPPIDPQFYALGEQDGKSEDQIQTDWDEFCREYERWIDDVESELPLAPPCMCGAPLEEGEDPCVGCLAEMTMGHERNL